jgi:uncharacterized membrane protein YbhN (UPF0104 family)
MGELIWLLILGYGLTALLMVSLILWGGVWDWLAGTRLLRFLFDAGLVALTDMDTGFVLGVPSPDYYAAAVDPVTWIVVLAAIFCLFLNLVFKTIQFHIIAGTCGSQGSLGQHTRAYLYGEGMGRLLPFNFGSTATVTALVGQGLSPARARYAVHLADLFTIFELVFFGFVALVMVGLASWVNALIWPFLILGAAFILIRGTRQGSKSLKETMRGVWQTIHYLSGQPLLLIGLCLISVIAFFMLELGGYFLLSGYTGQVVLLQIGHQLVLLGIICGMVAKLIPITPGGMGQFEWGMAAGLYLSGVGIQEAMIIPLLYNGFRYLVGMVCVGSVGAIFGIETSFRRVMDVFRGVPLQQAPATSRPAA